MGEPVLCLEELRKSSGETVALDGVSFDVEAGQMFGFVGPRGREDDADADRPRRPRRRFGPVVVPGRAAQGQLPVGELVVSLLLMVAAIVVVVIVAARVYDRSVLRFGTPMKLREAVKIAVCRG